VIVHTTKGKILTQLKRRGGSTVDELAKALGLAPMTVRQHLIALQRDDFVEAQQVRRPVGRPHFAYRLTDKGERSFPRRYDRLAELILDEVAALGGDEIDGLGPAEKTSLVLRRLADRLADEYAPLVEGKGLEERVDVVAGILDGEGGLAEWERNDEGFEIRDFNCSFSRVAALNGHHCEWHRRFLTRMLDRDVRFEHVVREGVECCRYVIEAQQASG
jgi:predicted ArsR family transcriptional regulator